MMRAPAAAKDGDKFEDQCLSFIFRRGIWVAGNIDLGGCNDEGFLICSLNKVVVGVGHLDEIASLRRKGYEFVWLPTRLTQNIYLSILNKLLIKTQDLPRLTEEEKLVYYSQLRESEYPPIEDFADAVAKNDEESLEVYKQACNEVKLKYPKNEE